MIVPAEKPYRALVESLDGKNVENVDQLAVYRLINADCLVERDIDNLVVLDAYHDVALPILQSFDCCDSQAAGKDAVLSCRTSASLQMSEDGHTRFVLRIFMNQTVCIIVGTACAVLLAL